MPAPTCSLNEWSLFCSWDHRFMAWTTWIILPDHSTLPGTCSSRWLHSCHRPLPARWGSSFRSQGSCCPGIERLAGGQGGKSQPEISKQTSSLSENASWCWKYYLPNAYFLWNANFLLYDSSLNWESSLFFLQSSQINILILLDMSGVLN